MTGRTLSHYEIREKLGEGGMGVVYRARDTHLDRFVAIKVLAPDKVTDPERKRRFVPEAKAASALNHPNIITVHDIAQAEVARASGPATPGGPEGPPYRIDFIVMEYVAGKTLDKLIGRKGGARGTRLGETLKYAVEIADALAAAHSAGIVHRDVKPSNVMITDEGRVKILDFGLAKLLEPADYSPDAATLSVRPMTEEGTVLGTAAYMSPEQAEGRKLDGRSDIFSFGAVVYEMVTGRRPFTGDSRLSVLTKILNEDPTPPSQLASSIPPELEKLILRCLRKDPARRYQYMADVKVALEDLQEESSSGQQAATIPPGSRWRWVWAALLPALLAAGFLAWQRWRARQPAEPLRAVALTTFPGTELYPSFSPDGNHVAFTWNGPKQDNYDIYVQMIGSGSPLRLTTDPRNDYSPAWSPDGRWIAFLRRESSSPAGKSELRLIPPLGGPERKVADIRIREAFVYPPHLAWCPDSDCLVVTDSPGEAKPDALFVLPLDSGEKRQLTNPQPPILGDSNPAVSPDGRLLVFRRNLGAGTGELHWLPLRKDVTAGREPTRLTMAALNAEYPTWMPNGKEVLFSARGSLWRLAISGEKGDLPARLPFVGEDGFMPVVSRPQPGRLSRLVYVRSFADVNIWRVETSAPGVPASSPPAVSIASTRWEANPQFSPDGRRVAFGSDRSGEWEIWLADPDGANAVQLTSMGALMTGTPRWSRDGQLIAFGSNLEGQYEIYVVPAAGGRARRLTSHPANEDQIWKVPASGGDAVQVTHNGGYVAFESPDHASVYYTQTAGRPSALWRLPTSGGEPVKVLEGVVQRAFVVLEKGIYYIDQPSAETRLQFFDFATGGSTTVARNLGPIWLGLTASPDGRTILYTRVDSSTDDLMLVENFR